MSHARPKDAATVLVLADPQGPLARLVQREGWSLGASVDDAIEAAPEARVILFERELDPDPVPLAKRLRAASRSARLLAVAGGGAAAELHRAGVDAVLDPGWAPEDVAGFVAASLSRWRADAELSLEEMVADSGIATLVLDRDLRVVSANPPLLEVLAMPAEEVLGASWVDVAILESEREHCRRELRDALEGREQLRSHACVVASPSGKPRLFEWQHVPLVTESGERRLGAIGRDVTERSAAAARLNETERAAQVGNWEWRMAGGELIWSDEMYRIYGRDPARFVPSYEAMEAAVDRRDRDALRRAVQAAIASGHGFEVTHRICRPDGELRWVRSIGEIARDPSGAVSGLAGTAQDVTRQREIEDELHRTLELFRAVTSRVPVMLLVLEPDGRLAFLEGRGAVGLGLEPGEVTGRHLLDVFEEVPDLESHLARALAGETVGFDIAVNDVVFQTVLAPRLGPDGTVEGAIAVAFDITERRRYEAQLFAARRLEALGALAGGVAHDFNNLLSVILSGARLLSRRDDLADEARDDVRQILEAADRATSLTHRLLAFGRRQLLQPSVVDLNEVLRSLHGLVRRTIGEDIRVRTVTDEALPPVLVDRSQMEQVILNLVINARDAMPQGGTLTLATKRREEAGLPYAALEVRDTGSGMDAATRERVFEPFFTTKEAGRGTGLGLSMAHGVVRQSGGWLEVSSEPGIGSSFRVVLPGTDVEPLPAATPAPPRARGRDGRQVRLLLVEDEPQVRELARRALEAEGYEVITAVDGAEGLERIKEHGASIDAAIVDVVMPRMSGGELARHAAALGLTVPFLFMTGYTDDTAIRYGVERGHASLIEKPLTPEALNEKVREVLAGTRSGRRG